MAKYNIKHGKIIQVKVKNEVDKSELWTSIPSLKVAIIIHAK